MSKTVRKTNANRPGVVLVTAVAVLLMITILLTAVVGYVSVNRNQTNENYKKEQAYLTASSTVQSFVAQIQQDTAAPADPTAAAVQAQKQAIEALQSLAAANGGKGTTVDVSYNGTDGKGDALGTTTLTIKQDNGSSQNLVLLAKTTYAGHTEQVAAHISTTTKKKPADLNNCIELLGASNHTWDNLNVVGDMASLNNTPTIEYSFQNDTNIYGSYKMYGTWYPGTANPNIVLKAALYDSSTGSSMMVSEGIRDWIWLSATVPKTETNDFNYINTDGTVELSSTAKQSKIGTPHDALGNSYDIDVYCCNLNVGGNGLVQYGNMYVYAGAGENRKGDAYFHPINNSGVVINGNLFVEGDLKLDQDITVTGKVVCAGSINNTGRIKGAASIEQHTSIPKTSLRDEKPVIDDSLDDYVYYPEDFFWSTDTTLTEISGKYKAFYNGGNTKTVKDFEDPGMYGSAWFKYHVTESCTWANNFDFNNNGNGQVRVLVDVTDTSGDIVIRMQNGLSWGSEWQPLFVVRNTSQYVTDSEDPSVYDHLYNCYFVSDSGDKINLTGADPLTGKSTHTGSVACNYDFRGMSVFEYETFVNMFSDDKLTSHSWTVNNQPKSDFILNVSDVDGVTSGGKATFKPDHAFIFFLMGEGTSFYATNNSIFQACWYAPQATVDIATQGMAGLTCCDSNGSTASTVNLQVCNIGVVSAKDFGNDNKAYYVFTKPSATSLMAAAKGAKDRTLNGFLLDRFDHY